MAVRNGDALLGALGRPVRTVLQRAGGFFGPLAGAADEFYDEVACAAGFGGLWVNGWSWEWESGGGLSTEMEMEMGVWSRT